MAFDPDAYLAGGTVPEFDPDAYLAATPGPTPSAVAEPAPAEETLSDRVRKFLFEPEGARVTREAIQSAVESIPHMAVDTAKMGYKGLRMAMGGPEERVKILTEDVIPSALAQGQQTAADIQSPFGTREWLRGAGQLGMMAAPGLELARELRAPTEVGPPLEAPPVPPLVQPPLADAIRAAREAPPEVPLVEAPSVAVQEPPASVAAPEAATEPLAPVAPAVQTVAERNGQILENRKRLLSRRAELQGVPGGETELAAVEAELADPVKNPVVHAPPQRGGALPQEPLAPVTPPAAPVAGDLWYSGVGPEGGTTWVTSNLEKAKIYARRRGAGGRINVYKPEQVGETAFADQEGNLVSPQEYATRHSEDTTLQVAPQAEGQPLPKPFQVLDADGNPIPVTPEPYTPEAAAARATEPQPATEPVGGNVAGFEKVYGPGEIPAGETISPEGAWDEASARAQSGKAQPYGFVDRAKTGAITPEEMGDLIYEHHRLVERAAGLEGMPEYAGASQAAKDFASNVLKPAETAWHQKGMVMQIERPVNLNTFTGMDQLMQSELGRGIKPSEAPRFKRMSEDIKNGETEVAKAVERSDARVRTKYAKVPDIPIEEAVARVKQMLKDCV